MSHAIPNGSDFWSFLHAIDRDLAEQTRMEKCPCGGVLHSANYPRSPRGLGDAPPLEMNRRFSFCCDRDGCRKRATPPSVRFLGRRVYVSVMVVLVAAMQQGPTARRRKELAKHFGVDRRTLARWQVFWREHFPQSPFWKVARARLAPVFEMVEYPRSIVAAFVHSVNPMMEWKNLLKFLSPISTPKGYASTINGGFHNVEFSRRGCPPDHVTRHRFA